MSYFPLMPSLLIKPFLRLMALGFITEGPPDLDGGSGEFNGGGGPPNGGGVPGTGTGSSQGAGFPFSEFGGVFGSTYFLFIPSQDSNSLASFLGFFDVSSFDDPKDGSSYSYRVEDTRTDRVPTINRVILTYRDLGLAKLTFTLTGVNDDGKVVSNSVLVQIGNVVATNALLTKFIDLTLTAFRPQLSVSRLPAGGPVSIIRVVLRGEVEDNQ